MPKLYKDYFNINPKYYAAVTADLIEQGKVSWKEFYPHDTFIKLLETTYKVLSGAATRSIWVEGAYGTGKSHAALTVKSMIDASDDEVEEYFQDFGLRSDLRDKMISVKNSGRILTIHRIGSAGIQTDTDLILAVQQSVMAALKENGIENEGDESMRDAFLSWLEKPGSRVYFDTLIQGEKYAWDFNGMKADDVEQRLKTGTDVQIEAMMRNVMKVLKENGQYGLFNDVNDMADWIKSIIEKNGLSAIMFVWDEFSEYFLNHPVGLTGFQTLIEISQSHPFYFMIVAHESRNLFADRDTANKTLGRFEPSVKIELPENMAFQLMAQAMKTTDDPVLSKEWEQEDKPALNNELTGVRSVITNTVKKQSSLGRKTQLSDKELQGIVPIHPYAALLLKHIATVFNSNQRSMFDFIISNDMTDAKGFKWFINQYGAESDINLLTIDLLWDFFCGKEKNGMNDDVRGILDSYEMLRSGKLLPEEERVLKTILLLQAISMRVTGNELLIPNDQNTDLAFAGTDWQKGKAIAIANGLIQKNVLFKKPVAGGKFEYCAVNAGGGESIEPYRKKVIKETTTQALIVNGALADAVQIPAAVKQRFLMEGYVTGHANFSAVVSKAMQKSAPERFKVILVFALNDTEMKQTRQQILKSINMPANELLFIESLVPMGQDLYEQYIDSMAFSRYNMQKNKDQADHYENQAMGVLTDWRNKIASGAFMFYDAENKGGQRMADLADLQEKLRAVNRKKYCFGLEQYTLNTTMYGLYQLANGAGFGIEQKLSGAYSNSNKKLSFEKALEGAWKVERYWEDPASQSLTIVHIKKEVEKHVQAGFKSGAGRVSIMSILEHLEKEPYGFMPSSVTAFIMGFVLKEYASSDYFWSNGSNNETMTTDKMKTMIANALNQRVNVNSRYKDEYIVAMTPSLRSFLACTSKVFGIPVEQCGSVESTRDQIRIKMKEFTFPVWCVKYILKDETLFTTENIIAHIIDDYMGIANTANSNKATENDLAEQIGNAVLEHADVEKDLVRLFTSEKCRQGMLSFIAQYQNGLLPELAGKIGDGGSYLECVKTRFNAKDANWVWDISTAEEKISDVILEYQIVYESSKILGSYASIREVVNAWNARTNNIKIPCEAVAKHVGDLGSFLWQLYYMKQGNGISEQYRQEFYDLLLTQKENFDKFYKEQVSYFAQDASAFLGELNSEETEELYNSFSQGQFTKTKTDYYKYVQGEVDRYLQNQWKKKLKDLWYEKTKTKSPADWSEKYETPILCIFSDTQRASARFIFQCIMAANPPEAEVKKAFDYLSHADFFELLENEAVRDACFKERIIGSYSVLLKDIALVRRELMENVRDRVYEWMDNSSVQNYLRIMADRQYKITGCDRAMQLIDRMDAEQLRAYLRDRILDDTDFGIQILKSE